MMTESLSDKYLGLPALVGADRSDCFRHLIDRVVTRINGWKEKTQFGREGNSYQNYCLGHPSLCYDGI